MTCFGAAFSLVSRGREGCFLIRARPPLSAHGQGGVVGASVRQWAQYGFAVASRSGSPLWFRCSSSSLVPHRRVKG